MYSNTATTSPKPASPSRRWFYLSVAFVILETILTTLALVPAQLWVRILPQAGNATLSGPFPASIAPVITALLYLLPTIIGFLSPTWQRGLFFAILPGWIGLGLFLIVATSKIGAFYLISSDHVTANVSLLELYAALGGLGWLARNLFRVELK